MDNILFSSRLKHLRKKAGYKSCEGLAKEYNARFVSDDKDILGSLKGYENENIVSNPTISVLSNLCDMLGCDVDYLIGRTFTLSKEDELISDRTGLSLAAIKRLCYLRSKINNGDHLIYKEQDQLDAINSLLEDETCGAAILENIADYTNCDYMVVVKIAINIEKILKQLLSVYETIYL